MSKKAKACRSAPSFSVGAGAIRCRWSLALGLDPRRLCRCDDGFGNHRCRDGRGRSGAARSDGDAAILRIQHGRLFSALARDWSTLANPPLIFHVNWFRKGADGKFLWPGFGENMRVLKWIIDRCEGKGGAEKTSIGWIPRPHDLDLPRLDVDQSAVDELLSARSRGMAKRARGAERVFRNAPARRACRKNCKNSASDSPRRFRT